MLSRSARHVWAGDDALGRAAAGAAGTTAASVATMTNSLRITSSWVGPLSPVLNAPRRGRLGGWRERLSSPRMRRAGILLSGFAALLAAVPANATAAPGDRTGRIVVLARPGGHAAAAASVA